MALPPIISNSPIGKLFRTEQTDNTKSTESTDSKPVSAQPQDVVEISEAAQAKLEELRNEAATDPEAALNTATQVRSELEGIDIALGLDPAFGEQTS